MMKERTENEPQTSFDPFLIPFFVPTLSGVAQQPQEFALPTAHVGEDYRAEIERVLRDKYQLRLESGKP
jgi:hypothetical protein